MGNSDGYDTVYNVKYLKRYGVVTVYLSAPTELIGIEHSTSIAAITLEVTTPCDPKDRCTARMEIAIVNDYSLGYFDDPQEINWTVGIQELKVLKAFPLILDALVAEDGNDVTVTMLMDRLESAGVKRGKNFNKKIAEIRKSFNSTSGPTYEQVVNSH